MRRILINVAACKTAWPHAEEPSLALNKNVRAIIWMLLIKESVNPFCVCTCGTRCSTSIPNDAQYTSKLLDANFPALSILMLLIVCPEKCSRSLIIYASKCANTTLHVDNRKTWDHLQDGSTSTIKYRNGPLDRCIRPQISPWILCKNAGDSKSTLLSDGFIMSFPCEQVSQE